jgi:hypothetical protein
VKRFILLVLLALIFALPAQAITHSVPFEHSDTSIEPDGFRIYIWGTPSASPQRVDQERSVVELGAIAPTSPQPDVCEDPPVQPCHRPGYTYYIAVGIEVGDLPAYARGRAYTNAFGESIDSNEKEYAVPEPVTLLGQVGALITTFMLRLFA